MNQNIEMAVEWLRNNYQDYRNISDLCDAMREALAATRTEQAAPSVTSGVVKLINPGSPEASAMIDSVLSEYGWPSNPKNAARAGFVAAQRLAAPGQ